jgi:hypothetical protein
MGIGRLHTSTNPRLLARALAAARVEWTLLDRGREFPKHTAASRAIVAGDRRGVARGLGLEASR